MTQLLYYNTVTKKWEFMAPAAIDYATKQVTVTLGERYGVYGGV